MDDIKVKREEALRRYRNTCERKRKSIEKMKDLLVKRYIEHTGKEPKNFYSL